MAFPIPLKALLSALTTLQTSQANDPRQAPPAQRVACHQRVSGTNLHKQFDPRKTHPPNTYSLDWPEALRCPQTCLLATTQTTNRARPPNDSATHGREKTTRRSEITMERDRRDVDVKEWMLAPPRPTPPIYSSDRQRVSMSQLWRTCCCWK